MTVTVPTRLRVNTVNRDGSAVVDPRGEGSHPCYLGVLILPNCRRMNATTNAVTGRPYGRSGSLHAVQRQRVLESDTVDIRQIVAERPRTWSVPPLAPRPRRLPDCLRSKRNHVSRRRGNAVAPTGPQVTDSPQHTGDVRDETNRFAAARGVDGRAAPGDDDRRRARIGAWRRQADAHRIYRRAGGACTYTVRIGSEAKQTAT